MLYLSCFVQKLCPIIQSCHFLLEPSFTHAYFSQSNILYKQHGFLGFFRVILFVDPLSNCFDIFELKSKVQSFGILPDGAAQ
jgi:hypothetical protein